MQVNLRVKRFDPEQPGAHNGYSTYSFEMREDATILESLLYVRDYLDSSLALRCSCRSAICGSCAMRINGRARLACKTKTIDMGPNGEEITIEPMGNMPVVKDLVVDMESFWAKIRQITPYLQPISAKPEREYLVSNEAMMDLAGTMNCILCGACVSDCTVLEVDKNFIAPAALAKAYRFVEDPRDAARVERLQALSQYGGVWDCTRCNMCVEVCPKDVAPMNRILRLRQAAIAAGHTEVLGARHAAEFEETRKKSSVFAEL